MSFIQLFFQGIPESLALALFAATVAGASRKWSRLLLIGVLQGVTAFTVRTMPLTFGVHSVILILSLSAYLYVFIVPKMNISAILRGVLAGFVLLSLAELALFRLLQSMTDVSIIERVLTNPWLAVVFGLPQVVLLLLCSFLWHYWRSRVGRKHHRSSGTQETGRL